MKLLKEFERFIAERERIRLARRDRKPAPWTKDSILATYRFCNVNRQDDPVTVAIQDWLDLCPSRDVVLNAVMARLFNNPATLERIGHITRELPIVVMKTQIRNAVDEIKASGATVFNAAYIVSTNGRAMDKTDYLTDVVLGGLAQRMHEMPTGCNLQPLCEWMMGTDGIGDFIANQVVTDLKYVAPKYVAAHDWSTFVMAGPGTIRGLNRLFGREVRASLNRKVAAEEMTAVRVALHPKSINPVNPSVFADLNNLSNCFCEFDKYTRAKTGEGRPKQRYTP